jgi:hypothetical protein
VKLLAQSLAIAALAVCVGGCGGDTVAVHGTAQHEGQVLSTGRVVFTPLGGGKTAFAEIQSDGTFQLGTERPNDGAVPGKYRVMIIQSKDSDTGMHYTTYVAPREKLLEVASNQDNEFAIHVSAQEGWQIRQDN